jgi:hypothetical protein
MAQAIKIRASSGPSDSNGSKGPDKWNGEELRERVENQVFGSDFDRVLAGKQTDDGQDDRDQENEISLIEGGGIDDRPAHFYGLYRTSDSSDIDKFIRAFEDNVVHDANWYTIEPHDCTHDREEGGPCKVYNGEELEDKVTERGNVPETLSFS